MPSSKDGLTARDVLDLLVSEQPRDPEARSDLNLFSGGVTWIDAEYDQREGEGAALSTFRGLLEDGIWYAMGFLSPIKPSDRPVRIEAPLWSVLDFDLGDGTVSGPGIHYSGVRFFEHRPKRKPIGAAEGRCRTGLIEIMSHEKFRHQTKNGLKAQAMVDFKGLTGEAFNRAWKSATKARTTNSSWLKPGFAKRA